MVWALYSCMLSIKSAGLELHPEQMGISALKKEFGMGRMKGSQKGKVESLGAGCGGWWHTGAAPTPKC